MMVYIDSFFYSYFSLLSLTKKSVLNNLTIINSFEIKRVIHFKIILTLGLFHVNKF